MFVMPPPLDQRVSSPTWQEVSSVPRTASLSASTPQNNLAGRPFLSWSGFLGEALSLVAPAKRIGTRSSSSTRFELSIIRPFELLDYLAGGCLCSGAIPARFPGILCAAWKSFNRWQLWSQGSAGGTSVASGYLPSNAWAWKYETQVSVAKFGGDPSRVTIFGSGSGAVSVHAHILSPQGDGLFQVRRNLLQRWRRDFFFQGAISQSGNMLTLYEMMFNNLVGIHSWNPWD